jgi:AGZA family xanthine/uracil permease-like MFS transporter
VRTLAENPSAVLPPVTFGSLRQPETIVALVGLLVIAGLFARRPRGAIVIGIGVATGVAVTIGAASLPQGAWLSAPRFETVMQADLRGALTLTALPLLLSLVMVDFFDTIGTATAIGEAAHLHDAHGRLPRLRQALAIDAASASIGGLMGVSSVTSYIESAAGVSEGARTGLHSVAVGLLFACAVVMAPLAAVVPPAATAPALLAVGFLMTQQVTRIDFHALDTAIPAFVIVLLVPLTWSIAHGIGYGFLVHVAMKVIAGRAREVRPVMFVTAVVFGGYFVIE